MVARGKKRVDYKKWVWEIWRNGRRMTEARWEWKRRVKEVGGTDRIALLNHISINVITIFAEAVVSVDL